MTNQFLQTLFSILSLTLLVGCQTATENKVAKLPSHKIPTPPPSEWADTTKFLTKKMLLDYIPTAKTVKPNSQNGIPFSNLKYNKVIAYDFAGSEEPYPSINEQGKFVPVVLAQQFLTQDQSDMILSTLTKNSTYGEATAACFKPHLALVLYRDNMKVNQINICLDCNYLISDITIPAETHSKVNKGAEHEYGMTGFTKSGKTAIINLCKELNFHYSRELSQ